MILRMARERVGRLPSVIVRALLMLVAALVLGALAAGPATAAKPVWLCKPGLQDDPCTPGLSTTLYSPTLEKIDVHRPRQVKRPTIDCFYVYPTVSDQQTGNANLNVDPEERSIALYQAARFSQHCRVYAPMYRQVTLGAILGGGLSSPPDPALAIKDVRRAFAYYLRHYNRGRGFVLIGHSQGAFVLRQLASSAIDAEPAVRRRLVSAILLGGNVLVKPGPRGVGGDFKNIPACRSATQLGCVIAFSTYNRPAPEDSLFGRSGDPSRIVLCTNPAALGGGSGIAHPIFPSEPFAPGTVIAAGIAVLGLTQPSPPTTWFTLKDAYRAKCLDSKGAQVLRLTALNGAPVANPSPTPEWGLHLLDANVALGDLVRTVRKQAAAYLSRRS